MTGRPFAETMELARALQAQGIFILRDIAGRLGISTSHLRDVYRHVGEPLPNRIPGRPPAQWTREADRCLAKQWGVVSASRIAKVLGVTKNAVIGRAYRLGLPSPRTTAVDAPAAPTLTDADFRGCRWIEGESTPLRPGMFCCAPTLPESAWCAEHRAIAYKVVRVGEDAGWTPERRAKQAAVARMMHLSQGQG